MAGLAWGNDIDPGRLTLGAFFEYGNGSYDTYNSFAGGPDVHGEGDMYHLGGGVLARMDFTDAGPGMFYTEASFRVGSVRNDYKNGNLGGYAANYESDAVYYGLHVGVGHIWRFTEKTSFDLYGKYLWTRQNSDSVLLSTGDPISFDGVESERLRLGGRFSYTVNDFIAPYFGAAYEYEFDGEARAKAYGYAMETPSLRGGTGIGEIGLAVKASKTMPLSVDLGVQGYVGIREGVTGSLQVRYDF
jgi:outer membrane autotransporter protein